MPVDFVDSFASYRKSSAPIALPRFSIAHISDMHFIHGRFLRRFEKIFSGLRGHDLDVQEALKCEVTKLKPDLIFATGDQTTWGDPASLILARDFLFHLGEKADVPREHMLWIPGNHDVLIDYYLSSSTDRRSYNDVFGDVNPAQVLEVRGFKIATFCFDSTLERKGQSWPLWPFIGSRGRISPKSFNEFNAAMQTIAGEKDYFKIALVHHHPLPIPYKGAGSVGIELTTMSNGGTFIAHMQESGMDLILHGHEHYPYSCRYSFNPDGRDLIVAAAGTACQTNTQQNSFNYLEVAPGVSATVRQYDYTEDATACAALPAPPAYSTSSKSISPSTTTASSKSTSRSGNTACAASPAQSPDRGSSIASETLDIVPKYSNHASHGDATTCAAPPAQAVGVLDSDEPGDEPENGDDEPKYDPDHDPGDDNDQRNKSKADSLEETTACAAPPAQTASAVALNSNNRGRTATATARAVTSRTRSRSNATACAASPAQALPREVVRGQNPNDRSPSDRTDCAALPRSSMGSPAQPPAPQRPKPDSDGFIWHPRPGYPDQEISEPDVQGRVAYKIHITPAASQLPSRETDARRAAELIYRSVIKKYGNP